MQKQNTPSRRLLIKSTVFGLLALPVPAVLFAKPAMLLPPTGGTDNNHRYPAIADAVAEEVVGLSHFDLDKLKKLVDARPELARATWDWGFGDWETALGAASHAARKDIAQYLVNRGARPDIFTFAMLGNYAAVKAMLQGSPGIQSIAGPHGISLLQHVKNGMEESGGNREGYKKLLPYLAAFGNADSPAYAELAAADKEKYLGDYRYGDGEGEGFSVKLNRRKLITLGRLGKNGGALYRLSDNTFTYNGAPSVTVSFLQEGEKLVSLTVSEPGLTLTAKKVPQ